MCPLWDHTQYCGRINMQYAYILATWLGVADTIARSSNGDGFCSQYSARHKGQASMTGQNSRIVRILICLHRSSACLQCLKNHILESPGIKSLTEEMCSVVDDDVVVVVVDVVVLCFKICVKKYRVSQKRC